MKDWLRKSSLFSGNAWHASCCVNCVISLWNREFMRMLSMPAVLGFSMLAVTQPSTAADTPRGGSYAAEGACYCLGALDQSIHRNILPTPVGGQSVKQICERIGSGPSLTRSAGVFNYPVYPDAQCGHGPGDVSPGASRDCYGCLLYTSPSPRDS